MHTKKQKRLEDGIHNNNLKTLFQVESIPKDFQMKGNYSGVMVDFIQLKTKIPLS